MVWSLSRYRDWILSSKAKFTQTRLIIPRQAAVAAGVAHPIFKELQNWSRFQIFLGKANYNTKTSNPKKIKMNLMMKVPTAPVKTTIAVVLAKTNPNQSRMTYVILNQKPKKNLLHLP